MKNNKDQFLRYRIIDRELHNKSWVKTSNLKKCIEDAMMETISERTIQKDIDAMKSDTRLGYYAPIEYNTKRRAYRYTDSEYSILKFSLQENEISALKFYASCLNIYGSYGIFTDFSNAIQKIISGINLRNKFGEKVTEIIVQTDTITTVTGTEYFEIIVQAIDGGHKIEFDYKKFGDSESKQRLLSPYLLKEYKNRWYVIGYLEGKDSVTTFGLDRMSKVSIAAGSFNKTAAFDQEKYFKNAFGITRPEAEVEEIVLEFNISQSPYIKSLPIHSSQKIIKETKTKVQISINVFPCYELYEYILSKTPDIKVISPSWLAKEIKDTLKLGSKNY